jgi:hypothetical protein
VTDDYITAIHEAAHAIVTYRLVEHVGGLVSIVPKGDTLGRTLDSCSDPMNMSHLEARILSLYAGGHAQRLADPTQGTDGCDGDDAEATELMTQCGWLNREAELRARSRDLVGQHWAEIIAVADGLADAGTLDEAEVEIIADLAAGDPDYPADALARYRALRDSGVKGTKESHEPN